MRTLIIDNFDSFTFNLAHLVATDTGCDPVVIRNDEPGWTAADVGAFDNVVISPGPGHPDRPGDFGLCAQVIRETSTPLLGVCLGYQGISSVLGGTVDTAPEPVHGRRSPILHTQRELFAGIPSPFSAVRYHSLAVTSLPDDLEAVGWTPDGILMALRHRSRPMWGVQFHPESVGTAHGRRLLHNFAKLTHRWHATRGSSPATVAAPSPPKPPPARPPSPPPPTEAVPLVHIAHRKLMLELTAERVFDACYAHSPHAFWLDSSLTDVERCRFSFMGDALGPRARIASADVWAGTVTVQSAAGVEVVESPFLDWIDSDLRAHGVVDHDLPFDFALGWVGYLGYELKAQCGAARAHRSPHPDAGMVFADRAVAFDHADGSVYLLALGDGSHGTDAETTAWLDQMTGTLTALATAPPSAGQALSTATATAATGPLTPHTDASRYRQLIAASQRAITAGETYEVCLTTTLSASGALDPVAAYRELRRDSAAPFGALLRLGELAVLSSSPERFLRVDRAGTAESRPMKGTRPRGATPAEDERRRLDLHRSAKDRSENLMIVDLVRHDLGGCAVTGSVEVTGLFEVETYPNVHQMVSTVQARLRPGVSAVECLRRAFPGGSMTGAPKLRTMEIIDALESAPRGIYSGALGYFALSGAADFAMTIRTLVVEPERVSFGVGGAIIALSDPDAELEETAVKATPFLRLLGQDFPGRWSFGRRLAGVRPSAGALAP
jgi:para-aminobenzoate synthetase